MLNRADHGSNFSQLRPEEPVYFASDACLIVRRPDLIAGFAAKLARPVSCRAASGPSLSKLTDAQDAGFGRRRALLERSRLMAF
jgi:hypothetical protein